MPTGSATAPCSDVPGQPVATAFYLVAVPLHSAVANYTVEVAAAGCHTSPVRTSVACDIVVPVPAYTPTVFSLSTLYSDGSYSRTFTHPAYAPRPPTTPQLLHDLYRWARCRRPPPCGHGEFTYTHLHYTCGVLAFVQHPRGVPCCHQRN